MDKKTEKLLLIDGHSIASRAFYGLPLLSNSEGLHTNAVLGFINILLNTISKVKPDYIAVAFDMHAKTFRHKMFEAYKGTRKGMPEELLEQIPVLEEVLLAMKIAVVKCEGYEADDILGTLAFRAENDGLDVVILSGDRDILQLATDKTMIVIPKTKSYGNEIYTYYAKDVIDEYGVTPTEFIDLKALMGDASDNIPGIPGIGQKRASDIIQKYRNLETALEHADEIKPPKAGQSLKDNKELGFLSKTLATIIKDAPVKEDYRSGHIENESELFNPDAYKLFKKLELKRLLDRFELSEEETSEDMKLPEFSAIEPDEFIERISEEDICGLFADEDLSVCAFSGRSGTFVSDFTYLPDKLKECICNALASKKGLYVFGLKDLLHSVSFGGERNENVFDIMIMAYLLDPNSTDYDYDSVSKTYLGRILPSRSDLIKKMKYKEALISADDREGAFKAAVFCADTAFSAFPVLNEKLSEENMTGLLENIEMPLAYSLYNMEREGVCVDGNILKDISSQLEKTIEESQKEIFEEAGEEFNLNSPKQLGVILFEKLHMPVLKKTKTGYSTSAEVLEKLAEDYPFVKKILLYRQAAKLKSTYADGLTAFIAADGRIHGRFNQTVTATGRISSDNPNLQNIPTRTEMGQEIRKAFVAADGCVFLDADYSQIELRLLAHLSGDENLIEAYRSDEDIHRITASKVFHTPLEKVTKEQRRNAKAVNFGIVYGISSFGLSQDLSITRKEAEGYIKQYFATYPKVKEFLDKTVNDAKACGYTVTMFSRRRPIPELKASNAMVRAFGERAAMNAPIQGSAADIIKIAMINVDRRLREEELRSRIVLQVHDELIIEAPVEEKETAKRIMVEEMRNAAETKVPLIVECNEGHDWYASH